MGLISLFSSALICMVIICFVVISALKQSYNKLKALKMTLSAVTRQRDCLFDMTAKVSDVSEKFRQRMRHLEDAVKDGFGVTVRNEVTEVQCEFNKLEMVMILAGVHKLLSGSKDPDDMKIYLSLIDKINGVLPKMKEGDEIV